MASRPPSYFIDETREEAIVYVRESAAPRSYKGFKKKAASMNAAPVVLQNRIEMNVDRAKSKWNEQSPRLLHRIKER